MTLHLLIKDCICVFMTLINSAEEWETQHFHLEHQRPFLEEAETSIVLQHSSVLDKEISRPKLMVLDRSYNSLMAVNSLLINLKLIRKHSFQQQCRQRRHSYSADTTTTHRRHSSNWGTPRPHEAGGRWLALSGGQTWRRFCCGGQGSAHYAGLNALLSEPALDSKSFRFCGWSGVLEAICDKDK